MNPIILVQARMGSSRLPGKVLMDVGGVPMIQRVMNAGLRVSPLTILSLSDAPEDDPLEAWAIKGNYLFHRARGVPVDDVLGRFVATVRGLHVEEDAVLVRITGDCPLLQHGLIVLALERFEALGRKVFVTTSPVERTGYADGQDIEVFTFGMLDRADQGTYGRTDLREHVTTWMRQHCVGDFLMAKTPDPIKWSVDTLEDLERVRRRLIDEGYQARFAGRFQNAAETERNT